MFPWLAKNGYVEVGPTRREYLNNRKATASIPLRIVVPIEKRRSALGIKNKGLSAISLFGWRWLCGVAFSALRLAMAADPWFAPSTIKIATESVVFRNAGATLRGTLYLPAGASKAPAVVVLHGASEPLADTPL